METNETFASLQEDNPLWKELKNNPPVWWKNILSDRELYVEIRKDNYLNVYYYGGNVAKIWWDGKQIVAETHCKYLNPKSEGSKYQYCTDILEKEDGLETIKNNIGIVYHKFEERKKKDDKNNVYTSNEKFIQGKLKLNNPNSYIDSEFAYDTKKKDVNLIRIDLVELRKKELVFVELKLISDGRLRVGEDNPDGPEIVNQMGNYADFVRNYSDELKEYYQKLLKIKKYIGLWNGEVDIERVSLNPELLLVNTYFVNTYFVNTYYDPMSKRAKRIKAIVDLGPKFKVDVRSYSEICR